MALLVQLSQSSTGWSLLHATHQVGRDPACELRLPSAVVSGRHARLCWQANRWLLSDFASRNGTYLNGVRLEPGSPSRLARGDEIVFGHGYERWRLEDAAPPQPLLVPNPFNPHAERGAAATILPLTQSPGTNPVPRFSEPHTGLEGEWSHGQTLYWNGQRYQVFLPRGLDLTLEGDDPPASSSVRAARYYISIAPDSESASVEVHVAESQRELPHRAHHYLLAYLVEREARDSRLDEETISRESEPRRPGASGWVSVRELCHELGLTREQLALQVHRLRTGFREVGLTDADAMIERKRGWLRLGVPAARLSVTRER